MCGITGILSFNSTPLDIHDSLLQMLATIRHRGPDGFGIYVDDHIGLGSARLSIIDLAGGDQPICNEDGTLWIVFNGEIFNYIELRPELEQRGHRFQTNSDTEVILHLFEEAGPDCLKQLNGQFAIAIWDSTRRRLFLARDRLGIRPLFYTEQNDQLIFGSEIKAILAVPGINAVLDTISLDQIFQYWSPLSPRTAFQNIHDLPPGHYLLAEQGQLALHCYWTLDFTEDEQPRPVQDYMDELQALLVDATQIRLRADVPVGAYLSGGLDSSTIAAVIRNFTTNHLDTFSIAFSDPDFDESPHQRRMADHLGTEHQVVYARHEDIGRVFPEVIWHTETPVLRTAPAPMFLLSKLVRQSRYKVVLTGEGADEFLAGYDIFKEARIRRFWAGQPQSQVRPRLLSRIYPDISALPQNSAYLASFFGAGLGNTHDPGYSHAIRWRTTSRAKRFFSDDFQSWLDETAKGAAPALSYPADIQHWRPLGRAQYLEASIFLPQYLLSSQGDRMGMAHSVEGRFPFLDYRVVEFCNRLPPCLKLFGLTEKYLLKKIASQWLPESTWKRVKRPYRAPIHRSFFNAETQDYVKDLLGERMLRLTGIFQPDAVRQLVEKLEAGKRLSETDDMALAGILSTQLLLQQFMIDFHLPPPVSRDELIRFCVPA